MRAATRAAPRNDLPVRVLPDKFRDNLAAVISAVRAQGGLPVLLSFTGGPSGQSPYGRAQAQVAKELNVPLVVYSGPRIDVVHPSTEGYEKMAAEVVARLDAEGYLSQSARPVERAQR